MESGGEGWSLTGRGGVAERGGGHSWLLRESSHSERERGWLLRERGGGRSERGFSLWVTTPLSLSDHPP